jgi:hypothetical protein
MLTYFTKSTYFRFLNYVDTWPWRLSYVDLLTYFDPLTYVEFLKLTFRYDPLT